ncbi:MAG: cohesin domain-containing protein, partial [Bryobacteraceae bacterium]
AGLNLPISFNPRASVGAIGSTPVAGGDGTTPAATSSLIPLGSLRKLTENDWALSVPNGLLQAVMTDRTTRVLQSPQVRAVDGEKASLRIGDRYPYATGSFQPGVGAVGVSPLVSTQFQFADVGVNVDLTPRIHGADEVTLHCELEISSIKDTINLGGLSQPIIGQRKLAVDIRVKDGQATIVGGLMQMQDSNSIAGTPGLGNIPILKRLFSSQDLQKSRGELLIALVPHIIRSPEITALNTRGVAAGNDQQVKLNFAPKKQDPANAPAVPAAKPAVDPGAPVATPVPEAAKPQAPPTLPNLAFLPVAAQVPMGQPVLVTLQLNNANDAFGASFRLKFNPKLVKVADVKQGTFLSSDSARVSFSENTLNDTGEAIIRVDRFPGSGGISGSGPLLTFTLTPQTPGTANVTVSDVLVRNAQLQPIAVDAPTLAITIK